MTSKLFTNRIPALFYQRADRMPNKYDRRFIATINPVVVGAGGYHRTVDLHRYLDANSKLLRLKKMLPGDYLRTLALATMATFGYWKVDSDLTLLEPVDHGPWPVGYAPKLPLLTMEVIYRHFDRTKAESAALRVSPAALGVGSRFSPAMDIREWSMENLPYLREMGTKQYLVEFIHQLRYLMTMPHASYYEQKQKEIDGTDPNRDGPIRPVDCRPADEHEQPATGGAIPQDAAAEGGEGSQRDS